ncbi:MAG: DUF262 domain-containing protein [Collinsella sp.]|nr:DUF262 domain-containing protein [Collinsella sp.]
MSIQPATEYLRQFVEKIESGIYAIPIFQRNFVWKEEQVIDLMDSIYKGYPIGTILLWKPNESYRGISKDILTDKRIEHPKPEYYILDGRQRLTAFYGCISKKEDKANIFKMYFNLRAKIFQYKKKSEPYIVALSRVYDTFDLLELMQDISNSESISDPDKKEYIVTLKKLNAILQQYMTGEIKLDNCSLEVAGTVFSRINSMGTDISNASMLQAVQYKREDDILVDDEIKQIIENDLSIYGFDHLSDNDMLKCLFMFVGRNFYDDFKIEYFEGVNLRKALDELKQCVNSAVNFLHDECLVLSDKLLPYTRQLDMLVAYFKDSPNPSDDQKQELKRWFYYTTYQQTFQNSSLTIVRTQFSRFKDFIDNKIDTAIDYEDIEIDANLDFIFSNHSAKSDMMLLTMIKRYADVYGKCGLEYLGPRKLAGNKPGGIFVQLRHSDRDVVSELVEGKCTDSDALKAFIVTSQMENLLSMGKVNEVLQMRTPIIIDEEIKYCKSLGLKIKNYG